MAEEKGVKEKGRRNGKLRQMWLPPIKQIMAQKTDAYLQRRMLPRLRIVH